MIRENITEDEFKIIEKQIKDIVNEAASFAQTSPEPDVPNSGPTCWWRLKIGEKSRALFSHASYVDRMCCCFKREVKKHSSAKYKFEVTKTTKRFIDTSLKEEESVGKLDTYSLLKPKTLLMQIYILI